MKYLGGKQRLGKRIAPIIEELWNIHPFQGYFEPFCGSLGVLKNVAPFISLNEQKQIIANDYHPDLIQMWREVQSGEFKYPEKVTERDYELAKGLASPNAMKAFIGFGMSFGGKYFGGYAQKYLNNKKEDFLKEMTHSLMRTAPLISDVDFRCSDYRDFNPHGMLIYADPPYKSGEFPIKYRRDTKYYDEFDHDEFWKIMRLWSKDNLVVISEMNAPSDFIEIWEYLSHRSACQSSKTRYKSRSTMKYKKEKLFIHNSLLEI